MNSIHSRPSPDAADVVAIGLGISLSDCASRLPATVRARTYDKIRLVGSHFRDAAEETANSLGVVVDSIGLAVTPVATICDGYTTSDLVSIAEILDRAAADVNVDSISGYSALASGPSRDANLRFIASIPAALLATARVRASVDYASVTLPPCPTTTVALASAICKCSKQPSAAARLTALCNTEVDRQMAEHSMHIGGFSDAGVSVNLYCARAIVHALGGLKPQSALDTISECIAGIAFRLTRSGEFIAKRIASAVSTRTGRAVSCHSVGLRWQPPSRGDGTLGEILQAIGIDEIGSPGTSAAFRFLVDAIQRGAALASSRSGGMRGVSVPYGCDSTFAAAAGAGTLTLDRLHAIANAGLAGVSLVPIPGYSSTETIAGVLDDWAAAGTRFNDFRSFQLVPVQGASAGDTVRIDSTGVDTIVLPVAENPSAAWSPYSGKLSD